MYFVIKIIVTVSPLFSFLDFDIYSYFKFYFYLQFIL